jgi:hypothetical protein
MQIDGSPIIGESTLVSALPHRLYGDRFHSGNRRSESGLFEHPLWYNAAR